MNTSATPHAAFVGWNCGKNLYVFRQVWIKFGTRYIHQKKKTTHRPSNCAARRELWLVYWCKWIFIHPFHIYFSIWVKFAISPGRIFCCWTVSSLLQIDGERADFFFLQGQTKLYSHLKPCDSERVTKILDKTLSIMSWSTSSENLLKVFDY